MKGKSRKVLAGFLAVLMVLSLLPISFFGGSLKVKAEGTSTSGNAIVGLKITDNSTSGSELLTAIGTTTLELEHAASTGGFKNSSTENKADMAFLLTDIPFEAGYTVSADVVLTEANSTSGNDGLYIGLFEGTEATSGYYAVGFRNDLHVRCQRAKNDGTYGAGNPNVTSDGLGTSYTITVSRTESGFSSSVKKTGEDDSAATSATANYSTTSMDASSVLYAGIAISACKGTVENMKITNADGEVLYDQANVTNSGNEGAEVTLPFEVIDNNTTGKDSLVVSGTTTLELEQTSETGGLKNDSTANKADMGFLLYKTVPFEAGYTVSADVVLTEANSTSGNDGLYIGLFEGTEAASGYYAVGFRNDLHVRCQRAKNDGTYGAGNPNVTSDGLGTSYTVTVSRTESGFSSSVKKTGEDDSAATSATANYSTTSMDASSVLYAGIAISACKGTVTNMKITNADGEVIFDQNNLSSGEDKPVVRKDWNEVAAPALGTPSQEKNSIIVPYTMVMGDDGADKITITMKNAAGEVVDSKTTASKTATSVSFTGVEASGTYTFLASAFRTGDESNAKTSSEVTFAYSLPLVKPTIASATSTGAGNVSVVWGEVPEAESYEVYADGTLAGTTTELKYVVSGLTVGTKYAFTVVAVRGADKSEASAAVETTVTEAAQTVWGFTRYGSSTDAKNNGYLGSANDGSVTVYSEGGNGKVVPNSTDGLAFYYTAVPTEYNFTLKADIHVDNWTLSNGQEGAGLLATDRLGENGYTNPVWNNQYMALFSKIEYYWNSSEDKVDVSGTKYTMKTGIGVIEKSGVTQENLPKLDANDTNTVNNEFSSVTTTLDVTPAKKELESGTYNIIGNSTAPVEGTIAEITDFTLEIQKNNTGYFVTYYDMAGNVISKQKYYEPDALSHIDTENVYVGFFASRNARATFSNIEFSTILASEDAPAESRPVTEIVPTLNIQSANVANTENYTFSMVSNVAGTAKITLNGTVIAESAVLEADVRFDIPTKLTNNGKNKFIVEFYPDPDQELAPYTVLANTDTIKVNMDVNRSTSYNDRVNLYVSPKGSSLGTGSEASPLDIYTAVKYVQPGQTIVLMEGTYKLSSTVRIERGIDGTADNYIRMVADPNASSRPVFDFQGLCAGMIFGGNYWYFNGFDCTKSQNAQKGIQVSGSHNILENIYTYHNGNTGLQISRLYSSDLFADWPSYNLILNCTSYGNADAGYEDADGYAAKLTVGDGNVFDGCLSYNNADDGWDLFAKVETGSIGSVTIQNCVAYGNGYLEDGTNAGNGNGFKMGGDSLSGYHKLINSYAFFNKAKGIDSNSCPDIQVENSISYNNESYNVAFYTNNAKNTDFSATGIISFKDETIKSGLSTGEQFKPVGTQDKTKYTNDTNYYWDGTKSTNGSKEVSADWFKSLVFTGVTRNADGTLNMNGFLELTDAAPEGAGATPSGTPSNSVVVAPETAVDSDDSSSGSAAGGSASTSTETVVTETTNNDNYIPTSVFTDLINTGKTLVVNVTDDNGNVVATYTIDGTKFTSAPASDFMLKVYENVQNGGIFDIVNSALGVTSDKADIITFEHVGVLNGNLKVKVVLTEGKYTAGTELKLYYFNESTRQLEDQNQTVVVAADNTVEFTITHCSSYVLVPTGSLAAPEVPTTDTTTPVDGTAEVPKTGDTAPLALLMVIAVLSGAAFIIVNKKRITE